MDEMAERIARVEDRSKSNSHRIDDLERKQDQLGELVTNMSLIAQRQDTMERDVGEIKADVKTLAAKPGKRWDSVVEKVILVVVTAFITFALVKIGIG